MTATEEPQRKSALSDDDVVRLLPALAEAERASEASEQRFVPPRLGILEEASSRRHQLVYGRRGVGKTTLLRRVRAGGSDGEREVIFIDIETLRGRPYPDVLIELLEEMLEHLDSRLQRGGIVMRWKRRTLRARVRELAHAMSQLLQEPQSAEHTVKTLRARSLRRTGRWSLGGAFALPSGSAELVRRPLPTLERRESTSEKSSHRRRSRRCSRRRRWKAFSRRRLSFGRC